MILLLLTHVWPWWLPAIRRDEDVWIALAVGQLSFWPLFAGLVGSRARWPITCLSAGIAAGYGMLWYCRWQFGFHGYGRNPTNDIKQFVVVGAIGAVVALIVYAVCIRALQRTERSNLDRPVVRVARSGAVAGVALSGGVALLLGLPWLCLAGRREILERGPTLATVAAGSIAGLASAGALWGMLIALVRHRPRFSWRRTVLLLVATSGAAVGVAAWLLMPLVRHHRACESLVAAGVEVVTWNEFYGARLQERLEQFGVTKEEPIWSRWHKEYAPYVTMVRIDGNKVAVAELDALADLRDDSLLAEVANPDSENRILQKLSAAKCIRHLNITFSAEEGALFPTPGFLNDEAFSHIAAIEELDSLKMFNARFSADGLERLVGKVDLGALHLHFCNVDNEVAKVASKFENLGSLALVQTEITDDGLRPLRDLENLQILWLDLSHLLGEGMAHVGAIAHLERLSLQGCQINDGSLRHLARLQFLRELDLQCTAVTGSGLRYLERLKSLEVLDLDGAALDDAGFMGAASLPWRVKINLGETRKLTPEGILQMHAERARLRALPAGEGFDFDGQDAALHSDADDDRHGFVETYEDWLEEESGFENEPDEVLVDAEMEANHNTIILYQYGVADEVVEAYRRRVLNEPASDADADEADGDNAMDATDREDVDIDPVLDRSSTDDATED